MRRASHYEHLSCFGQFSFSKNDPRTTKAALDISEPTRLRPGTDPHQSPIRIAASASSLAIAPAFYEQEVVKAFCELTHESSARSFGRLRCGSAVAGVKGRRSLSAAALDAAKGAICWRMVRARAHRARTIQAHSVLLFRRISTAALNAAIPVLCPSGHLKPNRRARET